MNWNDFENVTTQNNYSPIPSGTLAKVRMTIEPGGYNNAQRNWTGGYATNKSGYVHLRLKCVVLGGEYANKWAWLNVSLHKEGNDQCAEIGLKTFKRIMSSAKGVALTDTSEQARHLRKINSFAELNGLEIVARIEIEKYNAKETNVVKGILTKGDEGYEALMNSMLEYTPPTALPQNTTQADSATVKPAWAR